MLSFRQLDDLPEGIVDIMAQTEQTIIDDMARRIARIGDVTASTNWQAMRLEAIGATQDTIITELSRALNKTQQQLIDIFDEAATRTLASDNELFRAAGYDPVPLAENYYLQQIISAGVIKAGREFYNLTRTTANTATRQFEQALDLAHMQIVTGGMDYRSATKSAIRNLASKGIASIAYPTGWVDHLDVAARRAILTGVNQTAAEVQLANMEQLGTDLVETTAHPGARPTHAEWQGKVFSISGTHAKYPNFREQTGYGTGPGLCGWNCRHSFFPFFEGLSDRAYSADKLREYNNRTVEYNGEAMSLYDATQQQRSIERQIRRWKREASATDAAGLDSSHARGKVREWQATQRDFINQTGLSRDYFRERAGVQNLETPDKSAIMNVLSGDGFRVGSPSAPKALGVSDGVTPETVIVDLPNMQGIVPKGAATTGVKVIAGNGTSTPLRDIPRLDAVYGGDPRLWRKVVATAIGTEYTYDVHWYENDGKTFGAEIKTKNAKRISK